MSVDRRSFASLLACFALLAPVVGCSDDSPPPPPPPMRDSGPGGMDGSLDGGLDGGIAFRDAGPPRDGDDPDAMTCVRDSQCDDGLRCTGIETCVGGFCATTGAVDCDDMIDCTDDMCNEPPDGGTDPVCRNNPNNGNCMTGFACVPSDDRECVRMCTNDAHCDDMLACTGMESCGTDGLCDLGSPVDCSDGIVCTVDRCMEPMGRCSQTPDDMMCMPGERCVEAGGRGCVVPCAMVVVVCKLNSPQCGCPLSQSCYFDDATMMRTCRAPGTSGVGSACSMTNDCEEGVGCRDLGGGATRMCSRYCEIDAECPTDSFCLAEPMPTIRHCTQVCDPIAQTGCVAGSACDLYPPPPSMPPVITTPGYTDCRSPVGGGSQGFPCSGNEVCGAGFACVGGECRRYCDVASPVCPVLRTCQTTEHDITYRGRRYGVCQ